jgi:hypothetical protein
MKDIGKACGGKEVRVWKGWNNRGEGKCFNVKQREEERWRGMIGETNKMDSKAVKEKGGIEVKILKG